MRSQDNNSKSGPTVGVVLGHREGHGDLDIAIRHLTEAIAAAPGEAPAIIVAADRPGRDGTSVNVVMSGALVPELWAAGIRLLHTDRVALCSSAVGVDPKWIGAIGRGDVSWVGAGGTIDDRLLHRSVDLAVHRTRFARHAPSLRCDPFPDADLAADNAWYDRRALEQVAGSWADGFWEPFVHARLEAGGGLLMRDPAMSAAMLPGVRLRIALRQRIDHGRRHGQRWAEGRARRSVLIGIMTTPAVPVAMTWRALRARPTSRPTRAATVAVMVLLFSGWAGGELAGRIASLRNAPGRDR